MTLSMSWIRKLRDIEELVTVTDSRTKFGCNWDCCPKVFPLQRGDCVIALSGWTAYAYPLIQQAINALNMHPKLRSRALDICDLRGHIIRILNGMMKELHDPPPRSAEQENPDCPMLFSGYSWKKQRFYVWQIIFDKRTKQFRHHTPSTLYRNTIGFAGDNIEFAKKAIMKLLKDRGKRPGGGFDMEPFEVLRDIIRNEKHLSIGGAPQVVKTYRHMNHMPYGVFWPDRRSNKLSLWGRPLLDYEVHGYLILDPDSLETVPFMTVNPDLNVKGH